MPRTHGSDDLFRLIHSLSSAEKRYFKKFAQRHTDDGNKYLELFNAINQQTEFEETSLKKNFSAYPVVKMYLFQMIIRSLAISAETLELPERLMLEMVGIRIMQQKGLNARAEKELPKLLKEARRGELFFLETELLLRARQAQNISRRTFPERLPTGEFKVFADIKNAADKLLNRNRYFEETAKVTTINFSRYKEKDGNKRSVPEVDIKFLEDRSRALTLKNNMLRLYALAVHYYNCQQYETMYTTCKEWLPVAEKLVFGKPQGAAFANYTNALHFYIAALIGLCRYDEGLKLAEAGIKRKATNNYDRVAKLQQLSYSSIWLYWYSGKHAEGLQFLHKNLEKLTRPREIAVRYNDYQPFYFAFKILFEFSLKKYREAFLSISDYQSRFGQREFSRFFKDCELMKILIQLESGNYELANTLIGNILRKGRKLQVSAFDKEFLNAVKQAKQSSRQQFFEILNDRFPEEEDGEGIFSAFKIKDWIRSGYNNIPLAKVVEASNKAPAMKMK